MKKHFLFILILALLLPVLAGCQNPAYTPAPTNALTPPPQTTAPASTPTDTKPAAESTPAKLTREVALSIALKDAALSKDQVQDLDVELDRDGGILHYDVDFEKADRDYEYEIHAETGEILKKNIPAQVSASTDTTPTKELTKAQAQEIALKHAGFTADQVWGLSAEMDRDGGTVHYDVEFEKDGYDYDYEIDVTSGKILKSEKERD